MTKPKLEWTKKGEAPDFDAARNFLSLIYPDAKAKALRAAKVSTFNARISW